MAGSLAEGLERQREVSKCGDGLGLWLLALRVTGFSSFRFIGVQFFLGYRFVLERLPFDLERQ